MGLNKVISILSTFKDTLLAFSQLVKFVKSSFSILFSFLIELFVYNKFVSSANWWNLQYLIASFRSLMYKMNNKGPKTHPSGTPISTDAHSDAYVLNMFETIYQLYVLFHSALIYQTKYHNLLCQKLFGDQQKYHS